VATKPTYNKILKPLTLFEEPVKPPRRSFDNRYHKYTKYD